MKKVHKPVLVSGLVALGVLGLGACGGGDGDAQAASTSAVSDSPGATTTTGSNLPTDSATASDTAAATPKQGSTDSPGMGSDCTTDRLRAGLEATGQEMNSKYFDLTLTNISDGSCALKGYPGLSLTDQNGDRIGKPATRTQSGAAENVVLKAGEAAHAVVRTPDKGVTDGKCWPQPARIKVFPPNNTASLSADPAGLQVCGNSFTVGPFTAHAN
ncbi:serine/threonine protein kinase [Streptomyces dioscori]|uniref:Serine/threonine protein kinase n=1 Tax=Streptomyces dioscori TaxID=2109333 RepID=A0A2P8PUF0_9ACTN|nr:DUF4232 domain-containing protein [Streptomyces dioscori]PSM37636.1 serine/threonine protein kinase [Streptomyces dioscori]